MFPFPSTFTTFLFEASTPIIALQGFSNNFGVVGESYR